jgi:rhamnogalacturonyl hydrolase YesR
MKPAPTRRELLYLAGSPLLTAGQSAADSIRERMPEDVPPGVPLIIANTLAQQPGSLITDWFGSLLVHGLMRWHERGITEAGPFARAWLDYHLSHAPTKFAGPRCRVVDAGGIPISTYAGYFGLALPCYEMARQLGDEQARQVCRGVASIVMHRTARDRFGMVAHDDSLEFTIPDTCYFAVHALMVAYRLAPEKDAAFLDSAVIQLRTYIDTFLIAQTGLAKTMLTDEGLGNTYWTRASGWLMWAITAVLRHLPPSHPAFGGFVSDLAELSDGVAHVQDPSGGLRVLVDDPSTPLETTGTAMCVMGIHEAVRKGWLPASHNSFVEKGWKFVRRNITGDGRIVNAYTGWAVPAENRIIQEKMDATEMGWIPGFILRAADEMTTGD